MINRQNIKLQEVKHLYSKHESICGPDLDPEVELEFFSKEWLQKWLRQTIPSCNQFNELCVIDNTSLLCQHNKLPFSKVNEFKCTGKDVADVAFKRLERKPRRLYNSDLCDECLKLKIISHRTPIIKSVDQSSSQSNEQSSNDSSEQSAPITSETASQKNNSGTTSEKVTKKTARSNGLKSTGGSNSPKIVNGINSSSSSFYVTIKKLKKKGEPDAESVFFLFPPFCVCVLSTIPMSLVCCTDVSLMYYSTRSHALLSSPDDRPVKSPPLILPP